MCVLDGAAERLRASPQSFWWFGKSRVTSAEEGGKDKRVVGLTGEGTAGARIGRRESEEWRV